MTHKMRTEQCLITRTSWNYTANPIQILLGSTFLRHVCCLSSRRALLRSRTRCVSHKLLKFTTADVHGLCQLYPLCPHLFLLGSRWLVNFQHWLFGNLLLVLSDQPTNVSIHSPNYKVPWGPTKAYIKELLLSPMVSLILKTFIIGPLRYEPNVDITGLAMVSKLQSFIAKLRFSRHFNPHEGTSEPVFGARSTSTSASNGSARMWCPKSSLVLMPCNQRTLVSLWLLRLKAKCLKSVVPRGRTQMIVLARRSARALVLISRGCGDGSLLDPWQFWSTGLIGVSPSLIDTKSEYASSMWGNGNSASAWLWRFWRLKKSGYSTCLQQELTLMNSRNESKLDATWIFVGNSTAVIHKGFSFNSDGFVFTV